MKRLAALVGPILIAPLLPISVTADPVTEAWARVYRVTETVEQRFEIMQNIVEMDNREFVPLLVQSLEELLSTNTPESPSEQVLREKLIRMIVGELGEFKAPEAADLVYRVVEEIDDPYLRAEALIATGRVGGKEYADEIALLLRNLNLYRGKNIEGEETLAYGCIIALERLRDPVGYVPVFVATHVGYSKRIADLAKWALRTMVADPTDILGELVRNEADHAIRLLALEQGLASGASADRKLLLCLDAVEQGLANTPSNVAESRDLRELRIRALGGMVLLGATSLRAVDLAGEILERETDVNEWLTAIDVLQALGSDQETADAAARVLTAYLEEYNDRQDAGRNASVEQLRLITATIGALGKLARPVAVPELLRAEFMRSYSTAINKAAERARSGIK